METKKQHQRQGRRRQAEWGINWKNPGLMFCFLILAIFVALGHHFFYRHLDGKAAKNQDVRAPPLLIELIDRPCGSG
jgi:hypothetical protein